MPAKPTVLLVEDEPDNRFIMKRALERTEVFGDIQTACDGVDALRQLSDGEHMLPDLILTDLRMPTMDGFTLLAELRRGETTKTIPVVVLTSSVFPRDEFEATRLGCAAFFQTPSGLDELVRLLSSLASLASSHMLSST